VLALTVLVRAIRWRYLFPPSSRPPLGAVTSAYLVGQFFNNLLPLRAGEAARILALSRRTRTSRAETAATILIERVFDVLCLLVLLFVLVPWLPRVSWLHAAAAVAVTLALGLVFLAVVLALYGDAPLRVFLTPLRLLPAFTPERITSLAGNLGRGLTSVRGVRGGTVAFLLTTLSWVVMGLSFWLASLAFDLPRSPLLGILVVIATNLAQVLPSAPAAVGVFEAATLVALTAFGAPRPVALSYAVVLHVMNFLPFLVVGPLALSRSPVVGLRANGRGSPG
jgi:glycosyltransferase 2 family protein